MARIKTKLFFQELEKRLGRTPNTCRVYLNLAGFRPSDKISTPQHVENIWDEAQVDGAEKASRDFMARRAEAAK